MNDNPDAPVDPVERSPNSRRNALLVVLALVVIAALAWALTRGGSEEGQGGPGGGGRGRGRTAATVGVAKVVAADVPQSLTAIGTVVPIVAATVRPQLSGNIFTINFVEGQVVAKGQLLAQIDPRPYRLALAQAQANMTRDESQLNLARVDLRRYQTLLAQDSIARQQVETQAATVRQQEGTVAADRAAVGTARLNLQYTSITAPVSGRVGLRQADIGNYVTPGDANGIAVITQTNPIDVSFAVPQGNLPGILARRGTGAALPVTATDQSGATTLAHGTFLAFDNQIDATTGTVTGKARFPNPQGVLFPNQFVNISLLVDTLRGAATLPVTAVRHGAQGDFVFVLQPDKTVKMQIVKQGPANGSRVAILSGVKVGQTVITEGADNLEDGSKVMLPGERPQRQPRKKAGMFARLFGGGSADGDGAGAGNAAGGGNSAGGGQRRHRQGGGASQ
ncbi:efflux RND transporter periplasmic adaptor subunit [Sphingomonas crusticola]|uniref:efflux RND transporter periplasmic adaptor subunit n=1 Tax=Sphingomonas crusticola TaxID=1697973 RepID=UPI000E25F8EF|nr:efflux RND transporter periplasmic adaptor subunit [Sphingomonas crusticola]